MTALIVFFLRLILTGILFLFLAWVIYTLWRDLSSTLTQVHARQVPYISLRPLVGDQVIEKGLSVPEGLLGRDPTCEITFSEDTVSGRHARLRFHHKQWWIEDMVSTNGTFLNDEPVLTPTVLVSGDELRLGQLRLMVTIEKT